MCGHLFCWYCLNKWLTSNLPASNSCPVCKSGLDSSKVIPIYVRGREEVDQYLDL
jgi:E3 ubiquitin-protein ligase RNF5